MQTLSPPSALFLAIYFGVDSSSNLATDTAPPKTTPILIYGAGFTTGQHPIQLLHVGAKIDYVLDCVVAQGTLVRIAQIVNPNGGKVALLLPIKEGDNVRGVGGKDNMIFELPEDKNPLPKGVKELGVRNFLYLENSYLKENLMPKILPHLLESGTIQPNRMRLLDESFGSLEERVGTGLDLLRNNKVSGEKVVVKTD
ncbi:hypothetical protein VKT23_006605 [Stygiomarasmius scandens]|uniref:Uncharacterized protein n=1 Tax=Marasmiellus scandens TaxID=2682957 RepID=A0ABR1JPL6_9AGAR